MILTEEQKRILEYISAVNRGGWRPSGREVKEWRRNPGRIPARKGKLLEPAVPATPARRGRKIKAGLLDSITMNPVSTTTQEFLRSMSTIQLAGMHQSVLARAGISPLSNVTSQLYGQYEMIPGEPGRPAVYGPDQPKEKFLRHLRRLGWVTRDAQKRYTVTPLGDALLRYEAAIESEEDDSAVTLLAADNELAYGHVLGHVAECGYALIVDAYLGAEQLDLMIRHTSARRFLIGMNLSKLKRTELAVLIETSPVLEGPPRELRQAKFHDRWLIGDGKVYGLGASLNGIGKHPTTLVLMQGTVAQTVASQADDLWNGAAFVARTQGQDTFDDGEDIPVVEDAPKDGTSAVREVDGAYMHSGCTIRHKTVATATSCTRGDRGTQ